MANKSQSKESTKSMTAEPLKTFANLQEAGLGNMMGVSTVWAEAISDMGAEVASFVADRIKEDVKTQHEILQCKNVADLQHIQAEFIQKALDQYNAETGKLLEMGTQAITAAADQKTD